MPLLAFLPPPIKPAVVVLSFQSISVTKHFSHYVFYSICLISRLHQYQTFHYILGAFIHKMVVGCWRGYLSGARCRLAYGPD